MLFNSYGFLFVFAPLVYFLYWRLRAPDLRKGLLVASSYVFYGAWSIKFAALMLLTTSVDYFTAQRIEDSAAPAAKKRWLVASMISNLGVLAVFKYLNFFVDSLNALFPEPILPVMKIILPIGISFYTFESMSYTVDVYRGRVTALRRFIDYAHFVTMFPRLVAGPIVRYADLADQLRKLPARLEAETALEAVHFFVWGLAKKVLIADLIATKLVEPLFAQAGHLELFSAWTAALAYTAQLYFDFSGYSDMASGLALLLGLRLPRNFELPYRAVNISDFWRRWHISLSTWLRDYLYIPLGGNRSSAARTGINLLLTMLLGGLWHGAAWTFVAWGAFHGTGLLLYNSVLRRGRALPRVIAIALTFLFVVVGWVMFRAKSFGEAAAIYHAMLGAHGVGAAWLSSHLTAVLLLLAAMIPAFTVDTYDLRPPRRAWTSALFALLLTACLTRLSAPSPFLYFQF